MPLHSITCKRSYRHNHPNRKGSAWSSSYKVLCHKIKENLTKRMYLLNVYTDKKCQRFPFSVGCLAAVLSLFACTSTLFRRQNGLSPYMICVRKNWIGNHYWSNPKRELKTQQWWPSKQNFRKIKSCDSSQFPYTVQFDYFDKVSH